MMLLQASLTRKERIEDLKRKYYERRKGIFVIIFFFAAIAVFISLAFDRWKAGDAVFGILSAIIAVVLFALAIFFIDMFTHTGE
ncbi:MAG: hypothetical protein HYX24_02125 [Candidatus Aenigmarchaeota archaeon]|nr:hypothetical protein [Candidatus Aenigmarchaeota archaeon]